MTEKNSHDATRATAATQPPTSVTTVETPWQVEHEEDGYRLSHANDGREAVRGYALGPFSTPESAVEALRGIL